jgi:hypothetical protein
MQTLMRMTNKWKSKARTKVIALDPAKSRRLR